MEKTEDIPAKVLFTSSGGKDSMLALYELKKGKKYEVLSLLTTITESYERVSMHGVREALLERQAEALRIPLEKVFISRDSSNEEYEERMKEKLLHYRSRGVSTVIFGDISLEEIRRYREKNLSRVGMKGLFPLWGRDTSEVAATFTDLGFKAVVTCVDSEMLDRKFIGREYDREFLRELPDELNPCGENGEFHTFVYDGPIFTTPVPFKRGATVLRDSRFYFCDLIPV